MENMHAILLIITLFSSTNPALAEKPDGKNLYESKCASCHAKDGKGNKALAGALKVSLGQLDLTDDESSKKSDRELKDVILNGKGKMPSYKGKLTDAEVNALVEYIRELQKKK